MRLGWDGMVKIGVPVPLDVELPPAAWTGPGELVADAPALGPEVGRVVNLDRRTVRTHLGHIYDKLGATGHVAAVIEALKRGLIEL